MLLKLLLSGARWSLKHKEMLGVGLRCTTQSGRPPSGAPIWSHLTSTLLSAYFPSTQAHPCRPSEHLCCTVTESSWPCSSTPTLPSETLGSLPTLPLITRPSNLQTIILLPCPLPENTSISTDSVAFPSSTEFHVLLRLLARHILYKTNMASLAGLLHYNISWLDSSKRWPTFLSSKLPS